MARPSSTNKRIKTFAIHRKLMNGIEIKSQTLDINRSEIIRMITKKYLSRFELLQKQLDFIPLIKKYEQKTNKKFPSKFFITTFNCEQIDIPRLKQLCNKEGIFSSISELIRTMICLELLEGIETPVIDSTTPTSLDELPIKVLDPNTIYLEGKTFKIHPTIGVKSHV